MTPMNLTPRRLEPHSPTQMLIEWNNGESYALPYAEIRFACPCAVCVDEHTGKRILRREQVAPDVRAVGIQVVGRYAIQVSWSDGHSTGMYHFDRLWELCRSTGGTLSKGAES